MALRIRFWRSLASLAAAALLLSGPGALADSWALPEVTTYESPSKRVRLTVTPRELEDQLAYFQDKTSGKEPAGQNAAATAPKQPRGVVERLDASGVWQVVWDRPLINDVAPVSALVSDSGDYAVTFDNWHSVGYGSEAIVIYDGAGKMVRSLALTDFLPGAYFEALPRTTSSIWWHGQRRIDGGQLILQIVVPSATEKRGAPKRYVEFGLDLATGRIAPLDQAAWREALAAAAQVAAEQRAAALAWRAARIAPLRGPAPGGEREWHDYLREAYFRLDTNWQKGHPGVTVLRLPDAADYASSVTWVRKSLAEPAYHDRTLMFGSPSQANLEAVMLGELARVGPGTLKGMRIYIALHGAPNTRLAAAVARTGAAYIQLDPEEPIPQRPERLPKDAPPS